MATIKRREDLPDTAKLTADMIEKLGFKWELDYEYEHPDLGRRVQIRDEKHYTPTAMVARYRQAMKNGDKFPPIVVSKDGRLIDGNTRTEASRKNGYPSVQAFILNEAYDSASEGVKRRMHMLGAGFNARNGKGIDREEIRKAVEYISQDPTFDASRIAYLLGVTNTTVYGFLHEKAAREQAHKVGLHLNGSVSSSQLRVIGGARLNDGPFRSLTLLTQEAGLSPGELRSIVKSVKEAKSDDAAQALINEERAARHDQIAEYIARGKSRPPVAGQLRQRLGFLFGQEGGASAFIERNRDLGVKHEDTVYKAIERLTEIAAAQKSYNEKMARAEDEALQA